MDSLPKKCEFWNLKVWILKLKSVDSVAEKWIHTFSIVWYQKCGLILWSFCTCGQCSCQLSVGLLLFIFHVSKIVQLELYQTPEDTPV